MSSKEREDEATIVGRVHGGGYVSKGKESKSAAIIGLDVVKHCKDGEHSYITEESSSLPEAAVHKTGTNHVELPSA